jgi:hypothetical protein
MKKILIFLSILVLADSLPAQVTEPAAPMTRADYLKKSKGQKTAGFIFLGIGATCIAIAAPGETSFDLLPVLVIGGAASVITSIPLFLAAGKNKRKANAMSAGIRIETQPVMQNGTTVRTPYPAVSIRLAL